CLRTKGPRRAPFTPIRSEAPRGTRGARLSTCGPRHGPQTPNVRSAPGNPGRSSKSGRRSKPGSTPPAVLAVGPRAAAATAAPGGSVAIGAGGAGRPRRARTTGAAWRRLVHTDHPSIERGAVERGDGLLRLLGGRHLDEAEAPRASRLSVGHHGGRHHLAEA